MFTVNPSTPAINAKQGCYVHNELEHYTHYTFSDEEMIILDKQLWNFIIPQVCTEVINEMIIFAIRPKKNICVFRVTRPYLNFFIQISPTLIFLFLFFHEIQKLFSLSTYCFAKNQDIRYKKINKNKK